MNAELEEVMEVLRRALGGQGRVLENGEWRAVTNREVAERVVQWARTLDRERLHNLGKWGGLIHAICTVDQPELLIEIDCALEEYVAIRADLKAAAEDLPIPVPEPGTDMARLLSANVLLKSRLEAIRKENAALLLANHDCCAWFEALNLDHQKALKALDELARLGNGARYGNSIGNRIAQDAIASMID